MKYGLGAKISKVNWEDSKPGTVYLATSVEVALSYAETSELVPEEYLDQIVMLAIDERYLDKSKLKIDNNVLDNEGDTLEYYGIIPPVAIHPIYRKSMNENGRIIPGANTPPGITTRHTQLMGKRLGFNLSIDGRPPLLMSNGKINLTPQKDPDHSKDDKKSMFTGAQLTPWTNGKSKDMAE